ncbi:hypothetical protein N825_20545 [Skermanella stibiiresistens SB22]|uniref:Uncharacterized protein n=1 Tax=Skermanella stibiiresistens SB22 TaxID=1385369 RepID=W9HCD9_9PROT|nr:hypothetical protein N825_20545 [Skermanella stibiiresistens SB22]
MPEMTRSRERAAGTTFMEVPAMIISMAVPTLMISLGTKVAMSWTEAPEPTPCAVVWGMTD